ncbi:MAG: haloacid dehalogenase-like hydrolase, partial [Clostridia bacterium]|nr:haloacid dehalogenase-like hydrolase [Clostridia bacterium]
MTKDTTIVFMYDFDETLAPNYMQDYQLIPDLGYTPKEFWTEVNKYGEEQNIDSVCAYLYFCAEKAKEKG